MRVRESELHELARRKFVAAGLSAEHAGIVADVLVFADAYGVHSHGVMRTEYYTRRIAKGGINAHPVFSLEKTGPCTAIFHGDNGAGHVAAKLAMDEAVRMAGEAGAGVVGVRRMSHSGALSYFTRRAAAKDMVAISVCQSDPMVVPYGGGQKSITAQIRLWPSPRQGKTMSSVSTWPRRYRRGERSRRRERGG